MPIYEYQCQQCGARSEALQKLGDPPLEVCERCGGALKRLVSAPAVQFKGSGWYVTDYAKKSGAGAAGSASKTDKAEGGGGDKPDKPAESKSDKAASTGGASSASSSSSGGSSSGGD